MIIGTGTAVNVATVLLGSAVGVLLGNRLPPRTRDLVTDALGLVTLLIAALSAVAVTDPALADAVGSHAPLLIVLASLVLGGIVGSLLRLEQRVESLGGWLQKRLSGSSDSATTASRAKCGRSSGRFRKPRSGSANASRIGTGAAARS